MLTMTVVVVLCSKDKAGTISQTAVAPAPHGSSTPASAAAPSHHGRKHSKRLSISLNEGESAHSDPGVTPALRRQSRLAYDPKTGTFSPVLPPGVGALPGTMRTPQSTASASPGNNVLDGGVVRGQSSAILDAVAHASPKSGEVRVASCGLCRRPRAVLV